MTFLDHIAQNLNKSIVRYPDVLKYLTSRGVTNEDIKKYQIGFSKVLNFPVDDTPDCKKFLEECYKGRSFEDVLVFPLKDILGRVIGLSYRAINAKRFEIWVNEQAKFSGFFFGLPEALPYVYKENKVFLVEGFFDLLAFSKVFPNTVATLTAGINDNQFDMLRMFCGRIVTVFDSDGAGRLGSYKALFDSKEQKRKGVTSVDLKFKDPAKILEDLGLKEFKKYLLNKIEMI